MTKRKKKPKTERSLVGERVSIYRRGKRRLFTADFHYQGHRRKTLKTGNERLARRKAIQIEAQIQKGDFDISPQPSRRLRVKLRSTIQDYIQYHETEGTRRKTRVKY